ncbi:PhnD/SsuA/transferrin family substrate-binding protein [Pusillimonas harenae]|uniref:PhnD/SsuA/transferrin family substrate-binding protein n=2 Tax=Pollutimonas harenae TaxID=657015 RepID=A0A853H4G2_9BURK|nr:PhnD/SsuA/transferrin family substrate-binding protein [Pollutimonas harenae]TEA73623.1 ABC transporter substrate-binding protein [Pollutimonas harenae]
MRANGNAPSCDLTPSLPNGNVRRRLLTAGIAAIGVGTTPAWGQSVNHPPLRIGTTAVFLDDQLQLLDIWRADLQATLRQAVQFVQRRSYREIVDLLLRGQIDAAWICGYPYVLNSKQLRLVAVPQYRGTPLYRSYLIVGNSDKKTEAITQLEGKVFAYSDPLSNSGFLIPSTELLAHHHDPSTFFRRSFFTFAHRNVVQAVAAGLADGGAVDGYVWDTIIAQFPAWASGAHKVWQSPEYGFPPLVVRKDMATPTFEALNAALLQMHERHDGQLILDRLALDRFVNGSDALYDGIRSLTQAAGAVTLESEARSTSAT